MNLRTVAQSHLLDEAEGLDYYSRRGVALTRDAASVVIAALNRDAYEMRARGGLPNEKGADENEALARAIGKAVTAS